MKVDRTHFLMDAEGAISSMDKAAIRDNATRNVAKIAELERILDESCPICGAKVGTAT